MSRTTFTGTLCVYRESSQVEHLSASVKLDDNTVFVYNRCPKAFDDVVVSGQRNKIVIWFTANENGSNPRSVQPVSEAF